MTSDNVAAKRRVFLWSLVIGAVVIAVFSGLAVAFDGAALPPALAALIALAVAAFVAFVARDEYRVARAEGMSSARAIPRALRKTIDAFVLGK